MKIVGISGGSGAGKSTASYKLVDTFPETFEVLNLDDYQKVGESKGLPMLHGMVNWDHPDIIRWDNLLKDISLLQNGKMVTIQTWSHRSNPDYFKHRKMIPRTMIPKMVLIIEGYLSLWDERLRKIYDRMYWLDLDHKTRTRRRDKFVDPIYEKRILLPMHKKYVSPSKKYADIVLDVADMNIQKVFENIYMDLKVSGLLETAK